MAHNKYKKSVQNKNISINRYVNILNKNLHTVANLYSIKIQ